MLVGGNSLGTIKEKHSTFQGWMGITVGVPVVQNEAEGEDR